MSTRLFMKEISTFYLCRKREFSENISRFSADLLGIHKNVVLLDLNQQLFSNCNFRTNED